MNFKQIVERVNDGLPYLEDRICELKTDDKYYIDALIDYFVLTQKAFKDIRNKK